MAQPTIVQVQRAYRDELDAHVDTATRRLATSYGEARRRMQADLDALVDRMDAALDAGRPLGPSWLMQQQRYLQLREQLDEAMLTWTDTAAQQTYQAQTSALVAAQVHTEGLVMHQLPARTATVTFARLPDNAARVLLGNTAAGSPLYALLDAAGVGARQAAERELTTGLLRGHSPRRIARGFGDQLDGGLTRATTIARTEVLRSYREVQHVSLAANTRLVQGWVWTAVLTARTCAACWAMHGSVHPVSERLDDHPNGRCAPIPLTRDGVPPPVRSGRDAFDRLPPATQRAILGSQAQRLYAAGDLQLTDLVGRRHSTEWGSTRYQRSLRAVRQGRDANPTPRYLGDLPGGDPPPGAAGAAVPAGPRPPGLPPTAMGAAGQPAAAHRTAAATALRAGPLPPVDPSVVDRLLDGLTATQLDERLRDALTDQRTPAGLLGALRAAAARAHARAAGVNTDRWPDPR